LFSLGQEKKEKKFMANIDREFRSLLLEAVDEALSMLGETSREAIFFFIEEKFGLRKEEIPQNLEEFSNALRMIFGDVGCYFLEEQILNRLYARLGLVYSKRPKRKFSECISVVYNIIHRE